MRLTDVELEMLIVSLASVTVMDGSASWRPTKLRLERKLNRWRDHPDLEFAE